MNENRGVLTADEMVQFYGTFYHSSPDMHLDPNKVPERFWPLLPYAEFWGLKDEPIRNKLVKHAPLDVRNNLKQVVAVNDDALQDWLLGEASNTPLTDEYIAFAALIMAADYA